MAPRRAGTPGLCISRNFGLMRVTVLLFASYAEALGASSIDLELSAGARVRDLLARVRAMAGSRPLPPAMVAMNQSYAQPDDAVNPGDEIAIIPPVAGG